MRFFFTIFIFFLFTINILIAQTFEVDNIAYNITSSNAPYKVEVISTSTKYAGNIIIPELVVFNDTTYSVTSISEWSFKYCTELTAITIPNSVTSINKNAFLFCNGLTSITIPNSVTNIGSNAFHGCSKLISISIPNSVTNIQSSTFYECTELTAITIPNSVIKIENNAFDCTGLTSITIPNSVTSIGKYAFYRCSGLTTITIPNSVSNIGEGAFKDCGRLTAITIPSSVTYIGDYAFYGCFGLTSIDVISDNPSYTSINGVLFNKNISTLINFPPQKTYIDIPSSVTNIGDYAFYGCTKLTNVTIPDSVTNIGDFAFYYCTGLTNITIPNSVTNIGDFAFNRCSGLTAITIPNSVISIGDSPFYDSSGLTVSSENPNYTSLNGVLYNKNLTTLIQSPLSIKSMIIPNTVTSIRNYAFSNNKKLISINISNSVTSIGDFAFTNCTGLINITIPNSVTNIGDYAFEGCLNLNSISCYATIPPILGIDCFRYISITIPLYIPNQSIQLYNLAGQWKDFDIIGIIPVIGKGKNTVIGHIYLDENANGKKDTLELGVPNQKTLIFPDSIYTYSNNEGDFSFKADTDSYKIKIILLENWQLTSDSSSYSITVNSDTSGFDFGIKGINNIQNLETSIASSSASRCSATIPFYITFVNKGTQISNGVLIFRPDKKLLNFSFAKPLPDSIVNDTSFIYWNYSNLKPGEYRKIKFNIQMPNFTAMGDTLVSTATIKNGLSFTYSDTLQQFVRCSYDPNEKIVYPEGVQNKNYVLKNEPLTYTIHFQNTGNDTAYQIVIIDTLDSSLDLNTFEVLASSHNVRTSHTTKGKVEFIFENIMLVDSIANEPESHGFVKYKISPKSDLQENTKVSNKAYIFFDYNPAIITNEVMNTYVSIIPNVIQNINNSNIIENSFVLYPNPTKQNVTITFNSIDKANSIEIVNTIGQSVFTKQIQTTKNTEQLDLSNLQNGIYFIKVKTDNGNFIKKIVKD